MSISDYFTCTEIGGLTEVTYHNIYFKNYYFKELDGKKYIFPSIDIDAITINRPTTQNAKNPAIIPSVKTKKAASTALVTFIVYTLFSSFTIYSLKYLNGNGTTVNIPYLTNSTPISGNTFLKINLLPSTACISRTTLALSIVYFIPLPISPTEYFACVSS